MDVRLLLSVLVGAILEYFNVCEHRRVYLEAVSEIGIITYSVEGQRVSQIVLHLPTSDQSSVRLELALAK